MPLVIGAIVLIVLALLAWFLLGMGPRSGRVGDVSRTRVAWDARPIIDLRTLSGPRPQRLTSGRN
jgi:hypothetical protein